MGILIQTLYVLSGGPVGSKSCAVKIGFLNFIPAEEGRRIKDGTDLLLGAGTGLESAVTSSIFEI